MNRDDIAQVAAFATAADFELYRLDDSLQCDTCGAPLSGSYGENGEISQPRRITLGELAIECAAHVCEPQS